MADRLLVTNARVISRGRVLGGHSLLCEGGIIRELAPDGRIRAEARTLDAGGRYLAPGYIDLHIHGLNGRLIESGRSDLERVCAALPAYGVTSFLPTVCPTTRDEAALLGELAAARESGGARILGFFLEGQFLALSGAIRGMVRDCTAKRVGRIRDTLAPRKAVFGISPELPGIVSLLPLMTRGGLPAFITHTAADFDETIAAIDAGARHATHFYDVFPYPGEQEPGVRGCGAVEAIMARPDATVDFILDGEHVHPGVVQMALACKGAASVCLVTDANVNAGLPPGEYDGISGAGIVMKYPGGPARDRFSGGLTGSGLTLDRAVQNAVRLLRLTVPAAVAMASANPARVLGLGGQIGDIEAGLRADFSLLDDELSVTACFIGGTRAPPWR